MSGEHDLRQRLRELRVPDEAEAEQRSWEVVRAAYAERTPVRPTYRTRRLVLALAAGALVLAIVLSPAGAKVVDLVRDVVGVGEPNAKPVLRAPPAAGEILVESEQGPWIVRDDGSKRLLGDYDEATWSPHGLYVAAASGRQLTAVDTTGTVRWTHAAPATVHDPRWTGEAADTRIAYRSGNDLRVIAGDGADDHLIARDVAPVPPAWRPIGYSKLGPAAANGFVLTYVDAERRIHTVNADTGEPVRTKPSDLERLSTPPSGGTAKRALSPDGSRLATLERVHGRDQLVVSEDNGGTGPTLFSARGNLTGPTWSPDGRWLLVGWPAADQWLFIEADRPGRVVAFDHISEQFDPGGEGAGAFPRVAGWVLPER